MRILVAEDNPTNRLVLDALLQPLGLTQSIVRVGPKYMAKAIGKVFTDAVSLENTVAAVTAKSNFMRLRAKTMMREINEIQNQVRDDLKPQVWAPVESTFFILIQKLQLIADVPTWLGAYAKAQDQGVDEATAVALADQAVRDSQGSGQIGDLAQIQRAFVIAHAGVVPVLHQQGRALLVLQHRLQPARRERGRDAPRWS